MALQTSGSSRGAERLAQPLTLPCGRTAPNRLAKAPMEEMLGHFGGSAPTPAILRLYRHWAKGRWGMVITGNVAIDSTHLGMPFDMTLPPPPHTSPALLEAFRAYADAASGRDCGVPAEQRPLVVVQLVHAGRQSMRGAGRAPWKPSLGPSPVPMAPSSDLGTVGKALDWALFGPVQELSIAQIEDLIDRFASAAELCSKAGFDGVEIHGSHGYQLAAFLSPKTNLRTDKYGGDARGRARLLMEIVEETRKRVPKDFALGVKLNSADYVQGGLTEEDALQNVQWLAEQGGVDFVEISGGNYENPSFMTEGFDADAELRKLSGDTSVSAPARAKEMPAQGKQPSARSQAREAFFQSFAKRCREALPADSQMKLILTGGLRTRGGMAAALEGSNVDAVGIGRMAAVYPDLPLKVLDTSVPDDSAQASPPPYTIKGAGVLGKLPLKMVGAGWGTLWHNGAMTYLAQDRPVNVNAGPLRTVAGILAPSLFKSRLHAAIIAVIVAILAFWPGVARPKTA